jgi:hypothetical protein
VNLDSLMLHLSRRGLVLVIFLKANRALWSVIKSNGLSSRLASVVRMNFLVQSGYAMTGSDVSAFLISSNSSLCFVVHSHLLSCLHKDRKDLLELA